MLEGDQQYDETAAHWADMFAILNDIVQSNNAARIYLSGLFDGDKDNYTIRKSLYESAFISLRRAIKNGASRIPGEGRGTWKFPNEEILELIPGLESAYDEILYAADKCIAHRVSPEAGFAEVVKNPPKGKPEMQIKYTEQKNLVINLYAITEKLREHLSRKVVENNPYKNKTIYNKT